jgi:hypothetical protein
LNICYPTSLTTAFDPPRSLNQLRPRPSFWSPCERIASHGRPLAITDIVTPNISPPDLAAALDEMEREEEAQRKGGVIDIQIKEDNV